MRAGSASPSTAFLEATAGANAGQTLDHEGERESGGELLKFASLLESEASLSSRALAFTNERRAGGW